MHSSSVAVGGLVAATVLLWFVAAILKGIAPMVDPCQEILASRNIFFTFPEYLGLAGVLVFAMFAGILSCGFFAFGCTTSSLPGAVRAVSGVCVIIPIFVLLFYLGWTAFGTLMVVYCPRYASAIVFVAVLYAYGLILLLCGTIAFVIAIKKLGKVADEKLSVALKN